MQGIVFQYDPIHSRQYRQFTVGLSDRKKENHRWVKRGRSTVYVASDLPKISSQILDPVLFKMALESEMAFRRMEARFFSQEDEYTLLRISQDALKDFISRSQKKQILCDAEGLCLTFNFFSDIPLEIRADSKKDRFLLTAYLKGTEISQLDYLIRAKRVTGVYQNRILFLHPDIPMDFIKTLPLYKEITATEFNSVQEDLSPYGNRIVFTLQGKEQKMERINSICQPVLNLDPSLRYAQLRFWYDNKVMVESWDTKDTLFDYLQGIELQRNKAAELSYQSFLKHTGVQYPQSYQGDWYIPPRKLDEVLRKLAEKNFILHVNHAPLYTELNHSWQVETRNHNLYITGQVDGKTGIADSEELFKAFFERRRYVQLSDGSFGFISSYLMDELHDFIQKGSVEESRILFRDVDFPMVMDLLKDKENTKTDKGFERLCLPDEDIRTLNAYPIPKNLKGVLRPYQTYGFFWLMWLNQCGFNGILADDMGLGKTLQVLTLLLHLKAKGAPDPSLLVVPKTLIHNWEIEIQKFTSSLSYRIHSGSDRIKEQAGFTGVDLVITSYGLIRTDAELFNKLCWEYIILDEAQVIKNPGAQITRAIQQLHSRNRLSLSGTPVENSPLDLWSHFNFLMPGMLGNIQAFKQRYGQEHVEDLRELNLRTHPFILRRLKRQVCHELPPKTEITLFCDFTDKQKEIYNNVLLAAQREIHEQMEKKAPLSMHILTMLLRLRQAACDSALVVPEKKMPMQTSGKQEMVLEIAKTILSEGYKILIFSQFVQHLTLIEKRFDQESIRSFYLDGATKNRQEEIEDFQQCDEPCVFFISIKTGGLGLNLTQASYAFLLDPWWNPAVENQAIDRCYRIGQENPVTVYRFITQNSIEEKVMALKERKSDIQEQIVRESDMDQVPLTEEGLIQLLFQ